MNVRLVNPRERLQCPNAFRIFLFELLRQFETLAKEKGATPAQLALAWLMAQGSDIIPIPSNKTRKHLDENIKATEIKLSKEDLARLDAVFRPGAAAGPRSKDMHRVNI